MKVVRLDQVLQRDAHGGFSRIELASIWGRRKSITALDVCKSTADPTLRLEVVLHPDFLDNALLHQIIDMFGAEVLPVWEDWAKEHLPAKVDVARKALEAKRRWLRHEFCNTAMRNAWNALREAWFESNGVGWLAAYTVWLATYMSRVPDEVLYNVLDMAWRTALHDNMSSTAHLDCRNAQVAKVRELIEAEL